MSGKVECGEGGKTQNSCRVGEVAGNIPVICIANGAWNTNDLLEAIQYVLFIGIFWFWDILLSCGTEIGILHFCLRKMTDWLDNLQM